MTSKYDIGDLVRITGTLADADGTAYDPAGTLTVSVKDPSGNTTSYVYDVDAEVVQDDTGIYYVDVSVDEAGTWFYQFHSGAGDGQAMDEGFFYVSTPAIEVS